MTQRPIVTLIVERVETPVGFRTKGPNNRLIIVEGIGDMVMRSGKRMVCLKLRRSDEEGLQYVSYADDQNSWDIAPKIPGGQAAGSGASGGAGGANGASGGANAGGSAGAAVGTGGVSGSGVAAGGSLNGMMSVPNYANMPDGASGEAGASAGSGSGIMSGADCLPTMVNCGSMGGVQNPYPKYKYGSAFAGQKGENLSIELGTDSDVNNLENLWKDLSGRYSSLLGGYEPFYSVDAPADGQGKELFHLRVGPVKSLESGDTVCSQLGRSGVFCSVVRVQ